MTINCFKPQVNSSKDKNDANFQVSKINMQPKKNVYDLLIEELNKKYTEVKQRKTNGDGDKPSALELRLASTISDNLYLIGDYDNHEKFSFYQLQCCNNHRECETRCNYKRVIMRCRKKITFKKRLKNAFSSFKILSLSKQE